LQANEGRLLRDDPGRAADGGNRLRADDLTVPIGIEKLVDQSAVSAVDIDDKLAKLE
jgi:hypothetical protein